MKFKAIIQWTLLFWCQLPGFTAAQSPYHLNPARESALLLGGAAMTMAGLHLQLSSSGLSESEIKTLNTNNIPSFDRFAIDQHSESANHFSDILVIGTTGLTTGLLFDRKVRNDIPVLLVIGAESVLMMEGITSLTKGGIRRTRPYVYANAARGEYSSGTNARFSFVSGHTAQAACFSFFTAKVFCDYNPDSKWKPLIWSGAALLPAVTGAMRVKAGKHFLSDVGAGYLVGALSGWLIPHLHKQSNRNLSFSTSVGADNQFMVVANLQF